MARHPTSFRLSEPVCKRLTELAAIYGSKTHAVEAAITQLWFTDPRLAIIQQDAMEKALSIQRRLGLAPSL